MLSWDPTGKLGPKKPLPDHITILEPKEEPSRNDMRSAGCGDVAALSERMTSLALTPATMDEWVSSARLGTEDIMHYQ